MTYSESAAIVYRITSAYPQFTRQMTDEMIADMTKEWHENLKNLSSDRVMEAVTMLVSEQKWMPALSEVIAKILDLQLGTESEIIRALDREISASSSCIIFGQVTEEQIEGYERLTPFQKLIVKSPYEFNIWLTRDYEWKEERVLRVKREVQFGGHKNLNQIETDFDIFKALEDRKHGQDQ